MAESQAISTPYTWTPERPKTAGRDFSKTWRLWRKKPLGLIGAGFIVVFLALAALAPLVAPHHPKDLVGKRLEAPSMAYPLGTNSLGQDVLSRTLYGAQISLAAGITASLFGVVLGTFLGMISAYFGGWLDMLIQRGLEVLASFPGLILALIIVSAFGRSETSSSNLFMIAWQLRSLELAIGVSFIFGTMRVVRSAVLKEKTLAYIEAAHSIGAPPSRILTKHILPNIMPYVIISFSTIIGAVILIEASLSFLGYGVSSGTASWGADLSSRNREYFSIAPWLIIAPGAALSLTVLGYNFLGDALRDILDPRMRTRG